jgi:hypothetical protein
MAEAGARNFTYVPGLNQPGNEPLPNHPGGAGKKYSHTIITSSSTLASCLAIGECLHLIDLVPDYSTRQVLCTRDLTAAAIGLRRFKRARLRLLGRKGG